MEEFLDRLLADPERRLDAMKIPRRELLDARPAPPDQRPYARRLLHSDEDVEVLLMTWNCGVRCAPHDHDEAVRGRVVVLRGGFEERQFEFVEGELEVTAVRRPVVGACIGISERCIHDMVAREGDPPVTLHVYWPRIERMRVFDREGRRTFVVGEGAGAWLPPDEETVRRVEPWE